MRFIIAIQSFFFSYFMGNDTSLIISNYKLYLFLNYFLQCDAMGILLLYNDTKCHNAAKQLRGPNQAELRL